MNSHNPPNNICVCGRQDGRRHLQILLDASPSACFLIDREGIVLVANEAISSRLDIPIADLVGTSIYDHMDPEVAAKRRARADSAIETRQGFRFEDVHRGRRIASNVVPILGEDGRVESLALFITDVTDLEISERARRESELLARAKADELEAVMEAVPAGILIASDPLCRHVSCNRAARELLRLSAGQTPTLTPDAGSPVAGYRVLQNGAEVPPELLPLQIAAKDGKQASNVEHQIMYEDGSTCHILESTAPLRDENGKLRGAVAAFVDISEKRYAEEMLRRSEARFREIFSRMAAGVAILAPSPDGKDFVYLDLNPAAERQVHLTREQVEGKRILEVFPKLSGTGMLDVIRRVWDTGTAERWPETRYEDDGILMWFESYFSKMPSGEIVAVFEDLTERKQLEAELLQLQKMEAIGRLAGGVAHDFNNQLTIIRGYCKLLQQEIEPGSPQSKYLLEIMNAADRSTDITSQLLSFSRKQYLNPQVLHLNQVIAALKPALDRMAGDHILCHFHPAAEPDRIEVDAGQLQNAIFNLVANARDAMPAGGCLAIATEHSRDASGAGPGIVCLTISDTGIGISEDRQRRIFDPFFTTKPIGKGTGLGLATVYGFVKQSNGNIEVTSVPGEGSVFKIWFPVSSKGVIPAPTLPAAPADQQGGATVLVVEDEAGVRQLIAALLRDCGFTVHEANDGVEALATWRKGAIDLLITDVVMPKMGGPELDARLRMESPDLKVIYMSGYSGGNIGQNEPPPGSSILVKPFDPNELLNAVASALGRIQ